MANLKDLLVNGPSSLIGDVTITSLKIPISSNGTEYSTGSNGQVLKSNGTSVYWANDNFTITANATDGLWDLTGTNGTNSVTYALAPYSSKQTTASFYTGTTAPSLSTRLNYDGYLYAKKLYSDGAETITKNGGIINNSLTLQKSSTSPDSPELIFNGQAGNSDAYKWSIQKNSSGDLIFSKISSNNISTITTVFSANGYLLPNTTDTYDLGSSSKKWRNIYGNFKGNADTASAANLTTITNSIAYYGDQFGTFTSTSKIYTNGTKLAIGQNVAPALDSYALDIEGNVQIVGDLKVNALTPDNTINNYLITFSDSWQTIQVNGEDFYLPLDGTYIVQIIDDSQPSGGSSHWKTYWSGIFSWYSGGVNGAKEYTEIPLHGAGHAMNKYGIQLRTYSPSSATHMKLQIKGNHKTRSNTANNTLTIKFKHIM